MLKADIFVTRHAIIRMYERNHISSDIFDNSKLTQEVLDEFYKSKLVREDSIRGDIYKSDNFTIITENNKDENVNTIITLYPNGDKPQQEEKVIMNKGFEFKNIKLIKNLLDNDELIVLKHMGSKKLLLLNDLIVLARIENNRGKVYINIISKWDVELFKDTKLLDNFKEEYYNDVSEVIWIKFLQMIGIYDYIFTMDKIKETQYSSEVQIYKEVLSGDRQRFPHMFWVDDIGGNENINIASQECVRYLIEDYLKWDIFDIYKNFTGTFLNKYKLSGMVTVVFNNKVYDAMKNAYPELMIWKFKKYRNISYWEQDNDGISHAKEAIEWLITEIEEYKINLNKSSIMSINWYDILKKYNMERIVTLTFKYDYKSFFKEIFDIEFSDEECIRYYNQTYYNDDNKTTFVKNHR